MMIIFKCLVFIHNFISFLQRKIFISIAHDKLVLDVGSGDKPFWRADVIVDKYEKDNQQRASGDLVHDKNKIFVNADVEHLPFKDKIFDFVYCSHLLEHVENPDKAIKEITRVGKEGYIEMPRSILELLRPFPSHLWYCDYENSTLIFTQKVKSANFYTESTKRFGDLFLSNDLLLYLLAIYRSSNIIELFWKDSIKYKIIRAKKDKYVYKYAPHIAHTKGLLTTVIFVLYNTIYKLMTWCFFKKKNIDMNTLIK